MAVYADYIAREIKHALDVCSVEPQASSVLFGTPPTPLIKKDSVTWVSSSESNYAIGPMTKTIYLADEFGTRYKVSVEDLKHVKGHGWITHAEADELDVHYDKELGTNIVSTPEYNAWLKDAREKNFPTSKQMRLF